jgi:hypothetical protein
MIEQTETKRKVIMRRVTSFLDKQTERLVSRKFLAWLAATGLILNSNISGDEWVAVTLVYIGSQSLVDAAVQWKHGHKS